MAFEDRNAHPPSANPESHPVKSALPTIDDVARRAGVSTATVSRCLNSPERVANNTRDLVLAAVAELGYSPNFGAKALASKRTNTFGAIIPTMANAIFARGLQAFQEELTEQGANLLVASSYYDARIEEQQIRAMVARGADGLLLIGTARSDSIYQFLQQQEIPVVLAWSYGPDIGYPMVGFDNRSASAQITQMAIDLGHRRLAYISAPRADNDRARDRVEGTKACMRECGLDPELMPIIETPYSIPEAGDAFEALMRSDHLPTVVLCGNDVLAVGALCRAREMGVKVPDDISLTGFDDIELASVVDPGITTVHVPHRQMGRKAASFLLKHKPGDAMRVKLDTYIEQRGSLAPPRTVDALDIPG